MHIGAARNRDALRGEVDCHATVGAEGLLDLHVGEDDEERCRAVGVQSLHYVFGNVLT